MSKIFSLTTEQKETFKSLQKPTISLIDSYYSMPASLKETFVSMMAVYEANPTAETAKKMSDVLMANESRGVKQARIKAYAAKVSAAIRASSEKKYLYEKQSVPAGMPSSGDFLVGMGVISAEEKDALMDAQAACRLLNNTLNPQRTDCSVEPTTVPLSQMQHLDRIVPHVINITFEQARLYVRDLNGLFQHSEDHDRIIDVRPMACLFLSESSFIQKANGYALKTLQDASNKIKNEKLSTNISSLSFALTSEVVEKGLNAQDYLNARDYKELIDEVTGFKGGEVIAHHSREILNKSQKQRV